MRVIDKRSILVVGLFLGSFGCAANQKTEPYVPAMKYASDTGSAISRGGLAWQGAVYEEKTADGRAQLRLANSPLPRSQIGVPQIKAEQTIPTVQGVQMAGAATLPDGVRVIHSSEQMPVLYKSPLEAGDPGMTASLWRENRVGNEMFRDFRAWQAMDLITIAVTERSMGRHDADTEIKSKSEVLAAIENFFGLEAKTQNWTYPPDLSSLISATTKNDFKGEGNTNRQAELTARISAVIVEVLPSGLLRVEGEKIISVNNEEQVMVISGLVRQRDITSDNEVNSSKIAQMRIDYYGKGTVGEAQYGGWMARFMRLAWPF